ncbi:MAG: CHAD domain-containing protein [Bacteroidales bacterium]|nr:CHAD domain-containing protein [Bacteroidales bacterium]MCF8397902.1 CHAD domain-containing protein [Bacteroidales bacterium]
MKSKELEIKKKEDFADGIFRLFDTLHEESARYILAGSKQHLSVHELRKNIKKIRGILRLIRHDIGHARYHELNAAYREIAQQLAVLRDDTSQIELLEGMQKNVNDKAIKRTIGKAIRQIEQKRKTEFENFYRQNKHNAVCNDILLRWTEIRELELSGNPDLFILKSLKRIHKRARSAMESSGFLKIDEIYHYWRKQVKYLMYQLNVLNLAWPTYFNVYIKELNKLSDMLGDLHDLNLLNEHINNDTLIVLKPQQKQMILNFIYRRRSILKRRIEKAGNILFSENSKAFSLRIHEIWVNSKE